MAIESEISWTHDSANLWWGCVEAGPGCDGCYARTWDGFRGGGVSHWGNDAPRMAIKSAWATFTILWA